MRKNIYKWHRTISLIIAIPVVLWAASGFMHPLMTNFRPKVGTQYLQPQAIDTGKIKVSLPEALAKNNIAVFSNFRIVQMGSNWFYQLQLPHQEVLQYISTQNGKLLKNGDELYARHLAKQFLTGVKKKEDSNIKTVSKGIGMPTLSITGIADPVKPAGEETAHDCCMNATAAVLNDKSGATITAVQLVKNFNDEYKFINRVLPAYKVSFDRADGIRIYVETAHDRFAFAMDNRRAIFDQFFSMFHTLGWLDFMGKGKYAVEIILMLLAFLATLMGIYIFFITKTKKPNGNEVQAARRNHRWTSIIISLFTLMFTGSGALHSYQKFFPNTTGRYFTQNEFSAPDAQLDVHKVQAAIGTDRFITNISVIKIDSSNYWQIFNKTIPRNDGKQPAKEMGMDLMKDKSVPAPTTIYLRTTDYSLLINGEMIYANYLGATFSKHPLPDIVKTELVTKFTDEYGFINKRLPVWKINYAQNSKERWYVETTSGKLAAHINDKDLIEGYSFALLHKHHFMDFAGKEVRDFSIMFWALSQIAVVIVGLILWRRVSKNKKAKTNNHV